jgi:PKD repeat protein
MKHSLIALMLAIGIQFVHAQSTLLTLTTDTSFKDAVIETFQPNATGGNNTIAFVTAWSNSGSPNTKRYLLQFDFSAIPAGAVIDSAKLSLYKGSTTLLSNIHQGSNSWGIRRLTQSWNEQIVTWNNQPTSTPINRTIVPATTSNTQDFPNLDVTQLVTDVLNNSNYGFIAQMEVETPYRAVIMASSDYSVIAKRPKLDVYYHVPCTTTADFDPQMSAGGNVLFANMSSQNGPTTYAWDFGDGTSSTVMHPLKTYAQGGIYNVCLTISDSCGSDTLCKAIDVCTEADASYTYIENAGVVSFTANNTSANSFLWDFGDGTFSLLQNPVKTYSAPGYKWVCLTVTDSCGPGTLCENIKICLPPQPAFTTAITGLVVQFTAVTQNAFSYLWDFGDGNMSILQNPNYTYPNTGTYTVCLTVVDSCGQYLKCQTISVSGIGITEHSNAITNVYPNPTSDVLHIASTAKTLTSICLYTVTGQMLKSPDAASSEVDLSGLTSGMYLLHIKSDEGTQIIKILKQ